MNIADRQEGRMNSIKNLNSNLGNALSEDSGAQVSPLGPEVTEYGNGVNATKSESLTNSGAKSQLKKVRPLGASSATDRIAVTCKPGGGIGHP